MRFNDDRDWFFQKRFGMFVHWGLYAIHGLHEQEQQRFDVPSDEYHKLINQFNPTAFDPDTWLDLAETAGMEYLVFTTKHHDGFCMWNTALTDFNVMNTPYNQDIAGQLATACARRNVPLEFYYSVVDWHHAAYPNLGRHHEIVTDSAHHDMTRYMEFLKGQIRELCRNYGTVHGIWWDMNVPDHRDPSVTAMIRELQPAAVINNRGFDDGDYSTPERDFDPDAANPDARAFQRPTEACQSVGVNSWGFRKNEDYFSITHLMRAIDSALARGGNYLLNVGPDAQGRIPPESTALLTAIGNWYHKVKEAFCPPAPGLVEDTSILTTRDDSATYVHCPAGLTSSTLSLYPITNPPQSAILLNTGTPVEVTLEPVIYQRPLGKHVRLRNIPVDTLNDTVPIFKLIF
ncbi:MAG: alpha-L-fucosidase [Candidatus Pacebacteria bacterium]|nr:alpha-L-fucosidase [Candidatus Paceibacterota bacterium]